MNNTVTTSFLIAAGITLSACNVTTPTFSASENDQPDLAHYVARSDIAVNTVTASQQNVPQIANTARASASPARSSSGRAKGSSALQTAGFTQAASTGSRGQLSERGAGGWPGGLGVAGGAMCPRCLRCFPSLLCLHCLRCSSAVLYRRILALVRCNRIRSGVHGETM